MNPTPWKTWVDPAGALAAPWGVWAFGSSRRHRMCAVSYTVSLCAMAVLGLAWLVCGWRVVVDVSSPTPAAVLVLWSGLGLALGASVGAAVALAGAHRRAWAGLAAQLAACPRWDTAVLSSSPEIPAPLSRALEAHRSARDPGEAAWALLPRFMPFIQGVEPARDRNLVLCVLFAAVFGTAAIHGAWSKTLYAPWALASLGFGGLGLWRAAVLQHRAMLAHAVVALLRLGWSPQRWAQWARFSPDPPAFRRFLGQALSLVSPGWSLAGACREDSRP